VDWIAHTLLPVEQSEFEHWRSIKSLIHVVSKTETGEIPKYVALSKIQKHNDQNETSVTYEEIRDLDGTYIPCGAGEWVVWTDDQVAFIYGESDNPFDAMLESSADWVILEIPQDGLLHVIKSPYVARKGWDSSGDYLNGMSRGDHYGYTLPPEIEAGVLQDLNPEMPDTVYLNQHQENYNANGRINY
jgi:hypothetical protein